MRKAHREDEDPCRCTDGLQKRLCQPVYSVAHRGARKSIVGRVMICVDSIDLFESGVDPGKYEMSLTIRGSCGAGKKGRLIGYDTAHDAYHQQQFGDCHRHNCQDTIPQTPCDYGTVLSIFESEVNYEIAVHGYRR